MSHKHIFKIDQLTKLINKSIGFSCCFLLVSFSGTAWSAPAFVWSQLDSPYINVYLSLDNQSKIQLTSHGKNVLPALDRQNDEIWLSWIDKGAPNGDLLNYAHVTATGTILQKGALVDTSGSLYAPSVSIEPSGKRVWLVWAEHNGRTEVLFVSYLNVGDATLADWAPAVQITANDEYSANLPRIDRAASGRIEISWMRTGPGQAGRASATVSISLFDTDPALARQFKPVVVNLDSSNGGYPRVKYITGAADTSGYGISWKKLTRNHTALMGAVISDSGIVTRIVDRR